MEAQSGGGDARRYEGVDFVEFVMFYLIWVVVIQERLIDESLRSHVFLYALKTSIKVKIA